MKRRDFIRAGSIFTLPVILNGNKVSYFSRTIFDDIFDPSSDRVFVLVQQNGGNDGLNTFIPLDQYDNLAKVRLNILVPENKVIRISNSNGFHPAMTGIKELYDDGLLKIVQNVGYPNQNRSHFRSSDIWNSGSSADEVLASGWMGRYLDMLHPGYPEGYPNGENPHPVAITLGPTVSETCQGMAANFSLAITDPNQLTQIPGSNNGNLPDLPYGWELNFLRQVIMQTNEYAESLIEASEKGTNLSPLYPEPGVNRLADQLKTVAQLISGGLKTRIFVVNLGGFDTHANQVSPGDPTIGAHTNLLNDLSYGISAFIDDLKRQGLEKRVLGCTMSEFGRKIISNGSLGTDHGSAAPLLVFGSCVQAGILGNNPQIPDEVNPAAGVDMQFDFRDIFGSLFLDWMGAPFSSIQSIFSHDFKPLPLVTPCQTTVSVRDVVMKDHLFLKAYPNPFFESFHIEFKSTGGRSRISLFSQQGQEVSVISDEYYSSGKHRLEYQTPDLSPGMYILKITGSRDQVQTQSLLHF